MKRLIISSSIWILIVLFLTGSFLPEPKYSPTIMEGISEVPTAKSESPEVPEVPTNSTPVESQQPASTPAPKPVAPAPKPIAKATNTPVAPAPVPAPQPEPVAQAPQPQPPALTPVSVNCDVGGFNAQFLCRINEYRNSKGLNSLVYEGALNTTAYKHSAWMSETNTMSHIGRDGSKYFERCIAENTTCDAENVAMGFTDAAKLLQAWINSPSHNANLLGRHTVMGLGLVGKYSTLVLR